MTKDCEKIFGKKLCESRKKSGYIIIIGGLLFSYALGFLIAAYLSPYFGLGIVGLGTFLFMLTGDFLITKNWELNDGEFRKALTVSIISVYFYAMAFGNKIVVENLTNATNVTAAVQQTDISAGLFNNFWAVVLAVIVFYFYSRTSEEKSSNNNQKKDQK